MIVEKPEILKQWMTEIMEPMCDAEPAKLAKYVLALIKKDMPPEQLRQSMKNNLDIFLHDQAEPFVDRLFATLETKAYLPQPSPDSTTPVPTAPAPPVAAPVEPAPAPRRRVEPAPEPAGVVGGGNVRDRLGRRPVSRQRDREERTERRRSWEDRRRDRRSPPPPPPLSRDRRLRRSRSPPRVRTKSRSLSRPRSKSPLVKSRARSPRSRSRSPRSPVRRSPVIRRTPSRSRSPQQLNNRSNRSKSPIKFERSPVKETASPAPAAAVPAPAAAADATTPAAAATTAAAPAANSAEKADPASGAAATPVTDLRQKLQTSARQRCRDYDEKGLCMRGDQCPYDHGTDPVILQDVSMPLDMMKYSAPPPTISLPPLGVGGTSTHMTSVPLTQPPPPTARITMPEPYNPDAPSLTVAVPRPVWPNYSQPPPPTLVHVRPPFFPAPPGGVAGNRQLLSVPVGAPPPAVAPATNRPPPRHPFPGNNMSEPPRKRGHFDMSRLGGAPPRARFDPLNSSLELRKVPAGLNQISHLNNHFAKFGKVTNIQVCYGGDPEAALVTFSAPAEAKAAYKCTEAVLNNRFIKVFWHNKERDDTPGSTELVLASAGGQLTRTVTNPEAMKQQQEQMAAAKQQSIDAINHSQQMLAAKVSLHTKTLEKQKEARKLAADLRKRKAELLQKQIAQQKALLARLESKTLKSEERQNIIATVKELDKAIEGTRAAVRSAVDAQPGAGAAVGQAKSATKELTEKEVLDAEMDLYQKQQAGVDTSQLQRRVAELRHQLTALRGRGTRGRGFPQRAGRGRGRGSLSYVPANRPTSVDRRPTKLSISGFELDEKQDLLIHLAQFGEIVSHIDDDVTPSVVVSFRTRAEAEAALAKGRHFNDRLLTANWHTATAPPPPQPPAVQPMSQQLLKTQKSEEPGECELLLADGDGDGVELMEQLDAAADASRDHLLAGEDEEEEEDAEERSWRR